MGRTGDNLLGKRYKKLLVIRVVESKSGQKKWECKCDCGNIVVRQAQNLKEGQHKDCGNCIVAPLEPILDLSEPEKIICKKFGCGKELTITEHLAGDYCATHSGEIKIDISLVIMGKKNFINKSERTYPKKPKIIKQVKLKIIKRPKIASTYNRKTAKQYLKTIR